MKVQVWEEHHNKQTMVRTCDSHEDAEKVVKSLESLAEGNPLYYRGDIMAGEYWDGPKYFTRIVFDQ